MGCRQISECAFFKQPHMRELDGLSSLFKTRYCEDDHERCARYQVGRSVGASLVPDDMRPNDHASAREIAEMGQST